MWDIRQAQQPANVQQLLQELCENARSSRVCKLREPLWHGRPMSPMSNCRWTLVPQRIVLSRLY